MHLLQANYELRANVRHHNYPALTLYLVFPLSPGHLIRLAAFNLISVLISKDSGDEIASHFENGTRVLAQIIVGPSTTSRYANINRTSVLFVSVSFIILMIISLAWLIFYYVQRFRYIHAKDILAVSARAPRFNCRSFASTHVQVH